ncbi:MULTISPECIES: hypothetical protein [Herbaspirillum]|uniref:hypothetical protein n=1 Tax=Herbaspirillum TaxID=963 RepID=UPI000C098B89|nr:MULTISPECIES: hypothetical protein [Herbaspirillum]MAF02046.1 hypothetical protein [Herbaspirillum sp.]|tara:strand:- start:27724 stop:28125 length:402 start_codon:yes stop_codon:yes gene_type:complete
MVLANKDMDVVVFQLRKNGVEVKQQLLGDQPRLIGDLVITAREGTRGRLTRVARLQRESGEVLLEMCDVQVDAIKGPRIVLKGIEQRQTHQGMTEYAQSWLCIQTGAPLPMTSQERFFQTEWRSSTLKNKTQQ